MASKRKQTREAIRDLLRTRLKDQLVTPTDTIDTTNKDIFGNYTNNPYFYLPLSIAELEALEEDLFKLFNIVNNG